ncbi:dimethylaniline monooxygenase (N-oxide forming) [Pseudohyphozyma bogoriensis]|nr:dimethylaniline monooxygenase (N-oxide forming) [Pseudohyphozyma bogoriensis]
MATPLAECPSVPRWTFTQGILLGQASIVVLAVLFLKYCVFEDPAVAREKAKSRVEARTRRSPQPLSTLPPGSTIPAILSTLSYDLPTHPPETLDWLNVLLAQALTAYRSLVARSTAGNGGPVGLMEEILNRRSSAEGAEQEQGLVGLDRIVVSEVALGDKYPVLSNARVRPNGDEGGGVRVELDLDYTDHVSLSISTCLLVNFPRPRFAVLPISLGLTLERFSGTVTVELPSPLPPSPSSIGSTHPTVHFSLHPDFTLDLSTTSLLGSRAKLQDVPKVEQLILARLRGWITDRVVWPGRVQVGLPGLSSPVAPPGGIDVPPGAQVDGGWEWVEEGASIDTDLTPDADSDDGMLSGGSTPTVDFDADGGPTVQLHPRLRKPLAVGEVPARPPSPTESLPGFYRSAYEEDEVPLNPPTRTQRVAVIGAGSSGIAALHELRAAGLHATAYEARGFVGGQWKYEEEAGEAIVQLDEGGRVRIESPGEWEKAKAAHPTAMYDTLRTNAPTSAAAEVSGLIKLNTRVTGLRYTAGWSAQIDRNSGRRWTIELTSTKTGATSVEEFDGVVVANGHYSQPLFPDLDLGKYTGEIHHARWWRGPEVFRDKNVLVIGNSSSGYDIVRGLALQIYNRVLDHDPSVVGRFVANSIRSPTVIAFPFDAPDAEDYAKLVKIRPTITRVEGKTVYFADGSSLDDVDAIIFATGYLFSFPFASPTHEPFASHPLTVPVPYAREFGGRRVHHLDDRQVFYLPDPTLSFLALNINVIPFPLAQLQARLVARFIAGHIHLSFKPGIPEDGVEDRSAHVLGPEKEHEAINRFLDELGQWGAASGDPKWGRNSKAAQDLREGSKVLRKALLGY